MSYNLNRDFMTSEVRYVVIKNTVDAQEDFVRKLIPWFLNGEKETVLTLESALSQQNFSLIVMLGDQLYGHGCSYGFLLLVF